MGKNYIRMPIKYAQNSQKNYREELKEKVTGNKKASRKK